MSISFKNIAIASALVLCTTSAYATVVATNSNYGPYDGTTGTRILSVGTHGVIDDLNLSITFSKCDDPFIGPTGTACIGKANSFNREIAFTLTGPNGISVALVNFYTYYGIDAGVGRVTVTFDDQALQAVGGAIASGAFQPVGSLAAFNGMDMFGDYVLTISDSQQQDPLEFFSASLDVETRAPAGTVPEPGSWALLGLGLAGMTFWRKRATRG